MRILFFMNKMLKSSKFEQVTSENIVLEKRGEFYFDHDDNKYKLIDGVLFAEGSVDPVKFGVMSEIGTNRMSDLVKDNVGGRKNLNM